MALVTNQWQGSFKVLALKQHGLSFHISRCHFCFKGTILPKCRVSAFKDSPENDGSRPVKVSQNYFKPYYKPKQNEETIFESPKAHEFPMSAAFLRKWVTTLSTQSSNAVSNNFLRGVCPKEIIAKVETKTNGLMKTLWCYFWSLDATMKINMLIFIPLYLTIKVVYGNEVSKEMTPLYILGPLLVALYIKMLQALCSLYMFTFNQTVKVITNVPLCYKYVFHGQLKEDIKARVWQPSAGFKNLDYESKQGEFRVWLGEKYLDFIESVWPFYCRAIRLLKRAHFI